MRFLWLLLPVLLVATLPCACVESLYRFGLSYVDERPLSATGHGLSRVHYALWHSVEGERDLSLPYAWPWSASRLATASAPYWVKRPPGGALRHHLALFSARIWLLRNLDVEELLCEYADQPYFGRDAYGVEEAARAYFGIEASELNRSQAAMLISLLHAPAEDTRDCGSTWVLNHHRYLLKQLRRAGRISETEWAEATASPASCQVR